MLDRFTVRPLCCWILDIAFHRVARSNFLFSNCRAKTCKLLIIRTMTFLIYRVNVKNLYS